jgi:hypothetical protein
MKEWFFTCKKKYNAIEAFRHLGMIDWDINFRKDKSYNYDIEISDIVYVYQGKPMSAIAIKAEVVDIIEVVDITNYETLSLINGRRRKLADDTIYGGDFNNLNIGDRFVQLKKINILNVFGTNQLCEDNLTKKGLIKKYFFQGKRHLENQTELKREISSVFSNSNNLL